MVLRHPECYRRQWLCGLAALLLGAIPAGVVAAEPPPTLTAVPPLLVVGLPGPVQQYVPPERVQTIRLFEAELAIAIARTQGFKVAFKLAPLDELFRALSAGEIAFIPGLGRTPDRQARFDFTVPHNRMNVNIFVRRGDTRISSADDLPGHTIFLIKDSYTHKWAVEKGYGPHLIPVPDIMEALRRLSAGEGDCLLSKQVNIFAAIRTLGINNIVLRGPPVAGLQTDLCVAVRAGNRDLLAQLNEALFTLKQTGELDRIYETWLGVPDPRAEALARYVRYTIFVALLLLLLAGTTWAIYLTKERRNRAHLAEIEHHVAERTEELAAAKARFEAVVANTPASIMLHDPHDRAQPTRIVECNEMACQIHGYTKAELIGIPLNRLRTEPFTPEELTTIVTELRQGRRRHGQNQHRRKDGTILDLEFHTTLITLDGRELLLTVGLDITDRLRAETALRRTEEFQRLVLQATNDGIFEWDLASDRFDLSEHGRQMLGFTGDELPRHRQGWWQRLHPDDLPEAEAALQRHLTTKAPFIHTARFLHKDGSVRWLYCRAHTLHDATGRPARMIGSYTDITNLKNIDEELQLSRRLRAMGELVGGIAHEFNNLLTPIVLETSMLIEQLSTPPEIVSQIHPVLDAAHRAQLLTQRLLHFGRGQKARIESGLLATVVESTLDLLRNTIDRRITLRTNFDPALPPVRLDTATMGQAVMNLVLNARDTLLDRLTVNPPPAWSPIIDLVLARHVGPVRANPAHRPQVPDRSWQRLSVRDNGTGIPPEVRERMFEPFFTTKVVGQGTGLGLPMVWTTVAEHGGWIEVESTPDEGSVFHLYLPDDVTSKATPAAEPDRPVETASAPPAHRRLLLVDDDPLVGKSMLSLLERLGFTVTWLQQGDGVLQHLLNADEAWDALITDLNMPGHSGADLVEDVRRAGFRGKIVVISGHITGEAEIRLRAAGVEAMVWKPFDFKAFKTLMNTLWAAPGGKA